MAHLGCASHEIHCGLKRFRAGLGSTGGDICRSQENSRQLFADG